MALLFLETRPVCAYAHVGRVEPPTAVGAEGIVRGTGGEWPWKNNSYHGIYNLRWKGFFPEQASR